MRPAQHSRHSSQSSSRPASSHFHELPSYVQQLRMSKATVWAERGPKDAVSDSRKLKQPNANKKSRFGMKIFNGNSPAPVQYAKPSKSKLRLYAAPQHTTLVPRLSASEANDYDEFDNFASAAPLADKQTSNAPSITRSSLNRSMSRTNSFHHLEQPQQQASAPSSPGPKQHFRMNSVVSSGPSVPDSDTLFPSSTTTTTTATTRQTIPSTSHFTFPGTPGNGFPATTSRSGSPTQLQQYTTHHLPSDSDDEDRYQPESRPKLFIANADADTDSD